MKLEEAETLGLLHMEEHGLLVKSWRLDFENCKRSLGRCHYRTKKITLSKWYVELNEEHDVEDTILHEIAHALSYIRHGQAGIGHGYLWKKICREIGATPERVHKGIVEYPNNHFKYVDTCACGITYKRHRLSSRRGYCCPKCFQNLFVEKKDIVIYRNGKKVLDTI